MQWLNRSRVYVLAVWMEESWCLEILTHAWTQCIVAFENVTRDFFALPGQRGSTRNFHRGVQFKEETFCWWDVMQDVYYNSWPPRPALKFCIHFGCWGVNILMRCIVHEVHRYASWYTGWVEISPDHYSRGISLLNRQGTRVVPSLSPRTSKEKKEEQRHLQSANIQSCHFPRCWTSLSTTGSFSVVVSFSMKLVKFIQYIGLNIHERPIVSFKMISYKGYKESFHRIEF